MKIRSYLYSSLILTAIVLAGCTAQQTPQSSNQPVTNNTNTSTSETNIGNEPASQEKTIPDGQILNQAVLSGDTKMCDSITSEGLKRSCITQIQIEERRNSTPPLLTQQSQ